MYHKDTKDTKTLKEENGRGGKNGHCATAAYAAKMVRFSLPNFFVFLCVLCVFVVIPSGRRPAAESLEDLEQIGGDEDLVIEEVLQPDVVAAMGQRLAARAGGHPQ